MMFTDTTASAGGEIATKEPAIKKPSRDDRIAAWRKEHEAAYQAACRDSQCTCTPSKAQALLMQNYERPPID